MKDERVVVGEIINRLCGKNQSAPVENIKQSNLPQANLKAIIESKKVNNFNINDVLKRLAVKD